MGHGVELWGEALAVTLDVTCALLIDHQAREPALRAVMAQPLAGVSHGALMEFLFKGLFKRRRERYGG